MAGVTEDAMGDREKWKKRICCGDPYMGTAERRRRIYCNN